MKMDSIGEPMDQHCPRRPGAVRLLAVDHGSGVPSDLLEALAGQGLEVLSAGDSVDDGLRQALMVSPDLILLPFGDDGVLKFLAALDYMRSADFSPFVVLIADGDHGPVLESCERFSRLSVIPRERIGDRLVPHLLRLARQVGGED
jgi:hypothetical protein